MNGSDRGSRLLIPLAAAVAACFLPYVDFVGSHVPTARDLATYFYPLKAHLAEALRAGEVPWIDRYRWGGAPLLSMPGAAPFDPANILFVLFPLGAAVKLWILIRLATGVTGFAAFGRRLGLSPWPSALAGLLFALGGVSLSLTPFLAMSAGYSLLPWFAAFLIDLLRRPERRSVLPLAATTGLLVLTFSPELLFFAAVIALMLLASSFRKRSSGDPSSPRVTPRALALLGAAALLSAGLGACALLPALATTARSTRGPGGGINETFAAQGALPVVRLKELVADGLVADWTRVGLSKGGISYPYLPSLAPGFVVLLLAATGLLMPRWGRVAAIATTLLGTGLALGPATPLWPLLSRLFPPIQLIRFPEKHAALEGFGMAWLALYGLLHLERRIAPRRLGALLALIAIVQLSDRGPMAHDLLVMQDGSVLTEPPPLARLLAPAQRARPETPVRVFENDSYALRPVFDLGDLSEANRTARRLLYPEYGSLFGIGYQFELDYDLTLSREAFEWTRLLNHAAPSGNPILGNLLKSAGVTALVRSEKQLSGRYEPRLRFLANPVAPFRFARRVVIDTDGRRLFARMLDERFRADTAYVTEPVPVSAGGLGHGRILSLRDRPSGLTLDVEVTGGRPAFLTLSRLHDAAAEGTLDGRRCAVAGQGFGFAGVVVPPGVHQLHLRPVTVWVKIGLSMSIVAFVILAGLRLAAGSPPKATPRIAIAT